jgi:hypothetical protein
MRCVEVFIELKKKRYFNGVSLSFDEDSLSLEIEFGSNELDLNRKILKYYGFNNKFEDFGLDFDIFLNDKSIKNSDLELTSLNNKDKIKIYYNDSQCFNLYYHCLVYNIDNTHDDQFYLRKELEK